MEFDVAARKADNPSRTGIERTGAGNVTGIDQQGGSGGNGALIEPVRHRQPKIVCDEVEAEACIAGHFTETLVGEEERVHRLKGQHIEEKKSAARKDKKTRVHVEPALIHKGRRVN